MAVQKIKASAHLQEGVKVNVQARHFSLLLDEPENLGGTDLGMNPVEALLGSLGACQAIVARVYAEKFNVQLDDFRVEVEGNIDFDGFFGIADVRPGYTEIRYRFHITSPSSKKSIDNLIAHLLEHCPVGDSLASPVKLVLSDVLVNQAVA